MKEANKLKVFMIIFFSAMGGMLYGYDIGIIGGALPFIKSELGMTAAQESFLGGSVLFGGAFAILIGGVLADIFGRKNMITASGLIFTISVFMIYSAESYNSLLFSRLIQGVAVGFISITVPLYLTESVPSMIRGLAVTCFQLFLTVGILISVAISLLFISNDPVTGLEIGDWRNMFLTALIPGLIVFVGGFLLIKSPRWLIMKNREQEAEKILTETIGIDAAKQQMQEVKILIEKTKNEGSLLSSLTKRHYLMPMFIVFSVAILAQMTGINSILQYAPTMLKETGLGSVYAAIVGGVAITSLNFVTTIIAVVIADKIERKFVITFGTLMVSIVLLTLAVLMYTMPDTSAKGMSLLIGFILYIFFFAIGPGAYIWVIMSELLPTNIRSKGLAVALFLNSMASAILASSVMPVTQHFNGNYGVILGICGVCTLVYSFIVFKFVPKTNGRTLEEIEQGFIK
ncbi:sugar porter family MFS transporter [Francisella tularensis]|uniref:sugar porter family MFS transporter n=1 Tax=Francisella tularensis TaxID=263 RepID=UPI00030E4246|nr:sugar porter family MFS transporter [Francisella tularensis]MBK2078386.1 sugar porter family MFS transporter [Francisella tularensis subsp. mediasiatica]MBK2102158.1 sugar porter family MFS transporter [Francisella tularensis subsp. mediasiatica]MBK2104444.1 sugar porter family MFS transporter [Francisella tularensis subsp. mediasiatica]MDN9003033.1 sugar porter family MFS transporter [Francisella tularensis subsp. mediasiatica]MDN9007134.1 sugar porter family MFS transporter [Francisella t